MCVTALHAQNSEISGARIRAHVKFLASDLLEGRGVGTRGGELAQEYIATQFALGGAKPGAGNGSFFQKISLLGVEPQPSSRISIVRDGVTTDLRWSDDFIGNTMRQQSQVDFEAEAVFVGHGIAAPEYQWDDFKDVDVSGKVVVLFTNEPVSDDPKLFGGKALTYYGRWTYKYEEALRRGAAGCIILHTTPTATYGWDVVRSSWGKEDPQVKLAEGEKSLAFAGWITAEAGNKLLAASGHSVEELIKAAGQRDFRPIPLGVKIRAALALKVRPIESANVVAIVEGSDPKLKGEAVVFSAHWDHLGVGDPVNGDRIYNGAVDNASGVGMVIEMARAWAQLRHKPRRSAIFIAVTAEESGLRGSEYFAAHPPIPAGKMQLNLNFDSFYPFGKSTDVSVTGAERTSAYPLVEEAARRFRLAITPDPQPEKGHYYRSDHFAFAKFGVPAFSINPADGLAGRTKAEGAKLKGGYDDKNYHQPSDEYKENWDFAGMEQLSQFGFTIGLSAANHPKLFTWREGDEFLDARVKSGVKLD